MSARHHVALLLLSVAAAAFVGACRPPAAVEFGDREPFAAVVCRVEAESATIPKQTCQDGTPGPLSARVELAENLDHWHLIRYRPSPGAYRQQRAWQRSVSGGKVLMLSYRGALDPEGAARLSPCARLSFRLPRAGRYYLFLRGYAWCCGCQRLALRLDGDDLPVLEEPLWRGWWGDDWTWRAARVTDSGLKGKVGPVAMPMPFRLEAGEHALDLIWASPLCNGLALDALVVARLGRMEVWESKYQDKTLLHRAAEQGNAEIARRLLAQGAPVNARTYEHGITPLQVAERQGRGEIAALLLRHGAIPTEQEKQLLQAVRDRRVDTIEELLDATPVLAQVRDKRWRSLLHMAAEHDFLDLARLALARGVPVNGRDRVRQRTPLHEAAARGRLGIALTLISAGADIRAVDFLGRTPLHAAAAAGRVPLAASLIDRGLSVDVRDDSGRTPLFDAAGHDRADMVEALIAWGADVNAADKQGITPLHAAALERPGEVARLLLDTGARVNPVDCMGLTPLDWAVENPFGWGVKKEDQKLPDLLRAAGGRERRKDAKQK